MNTSPTPKKKIDTKVVLSSLWIVVMINMLKADILSLFIPGAAEDLQVLQLGRLELQPRQHRRRGILLGFVVLFADESADKIGQLNISPDLLRELLSKQQGS